MLVENRIKAALVRRDQVKSLRRLQLRDPASADFSSNDYLGVARNDSIRACVRRALHTGDDCFTGATGSRLLSGNSTKAEDLEQFAAQFHNAEAALLFNSGYDANLSLFSCVPHDGDYVVFDELIHASVHDGIRLGRARSSTIAFTHNSVAGMRVAVQTALDSIRREKARHDSSPRLNGEIFVDDGQVPAVFVAVESIYSMDGDIAPLHEMLSVLKQMSTKHIEVVLIVDEAHGVGVSGPRGEGVVVETGDPSHPNLLARVVTYGKAFGTHGAMVLGSPLLREYLVNYARPFIYSTALPPHEIDIIRVAYEFMQSSEARTARANLTANRNLFRALATAQLPPGALHPAGAQSPIQSVLVPGNESCISVCNELRSAGIDVYPIRAPTVPKGTERIRVIMHAHNTAGEIEKLVRTLASAMRSHTGQQRVARL
jgi:8-amino-7-oxononanoate synthase